MGKKKYSVERGNEALTVDTSSRHLILNKKFFDETGIVNLPPAEALAEALKWRGFLVSGILAGGEVAIAQGSTIDDLNALREMLREPFYRLTGQSCPPGVMYKVQVVEHNPVALYRVFSMPPSNNSLSSTGENIADWHLFKRYKFGHKVDTRHIDQGVALLVKVLPLAGVRTFMSCDGHGRKWPRVWFSGKYNRLWWEALVQTRLATFAPDLLWEYQSWLEDKDNEGGALVIRPRGVRHLNAAALKSVFHDIQNLSRALLEKNLGEQIREDKLRAIAAMGDPPEASESILTIFLESIRKTRLG